MMGSRTSLMRSSCCTIFSWLDPGHGFRSRNPVSIGPMTHWDVIKDYEPGVSLMDFLADHRPDYAFAVVTGTGLVGG